MLETCQWHHVRKAKVTGGARAQRHDPKPWLGWQANQLDAASFETRDDQT